MRRKLRLKGRKIPTKVPKPIKDLSGNLLYVCTERDWQKAWSAIHKKRRPPTKKDYVAVLKRLGAEDAAAVRANLIS